jgi:hypothetical protein
MTPEQAKTFAESASGGLLVLSSWQAVVVSAILAVLASALTAYLVKRFQNAATRVDLREVTAIAKRVETELAQGAWVNQQRWLFKKDLYLALLKGLHNAKLGMLMLDLIENARAKALDADIGTLVESYDAEWWAAQQRIAAQVSGFQDAAATAGLILSDDALAAVTQLNTRLRDLAELQRTAAQSERTPVLLPELASLVDRTHALVLVAAKLDLRLEALGAA